LDGRVYAGCFLLRVLRVNIFVERAFQAAFTVLGLAAALIGIVAGLVIVGALILMVGGGMLYAVLFFVGLFSDEKDQTHENL
jgi:hypothetical protein